MQLVLDEQNVGLVRQGTPLAVAFAVANAGTGELSLRQAMEECCGGEEAFDTVTIEPGQTGEVVALLSADDLLTRGRKHVRFHTSDPQIARSLADGARHGGTAYRPVRRFPSPLDS